MLDDHCLKFPVIKVHTDGDVMILEKSHNCQLTSLEQYDSEFDCIHHNVPYSNTIHHAS